MPLVQARQEINSILKGQVDQNSILAKNLNITNQQVNEWRSQGRLVDELNKRLEVFVAGNAIAARSIDGISSNIKDLIERLGRTAGEPFLEPLISALAAVEKYLKDNEAAITVFFEQLSSAAISAGTTLEAAFAPVGKTLLEIGADIGPIALSAIKGLLNIFVGLSQVLAPLTNVLLQTVKVLADFAATDLGGVVIQTAIVVAALSQLGIIIAGVAATALPALWAGVLATVTSLGTLYASVMAVATGNVALALSIPALQTAMTALTAQAVALNLALIPLTAAIGLTVLVRTTKDLEDANNALETYGEQLVSTAGAARSISAELNKFNKVRSEGRTLTDDQIKREKQLLASASAHKTSIQEQIANLKGLTNLNADQTKQRDNSIKQLEIESKLLDKAAGGLKLQGKELETLGTITEQFAKKVGDAQRLIKSEADGDPVQFKQATKEIIDLTQKQVTAKQISVDAARTQLEAIKNNTKVELDTQIAAKEAIDKLYDGRIAKIKELIDTSNLQANSGLQELGQIRDDSTLEPETRRKAGQQIVAIRKEQIAAEVAAITTGKAQIDLLHAQQRIGEAETERQITENKLSEIAKRIEANNAQRENATSDVDKTKLIEEAKQLAIEQAKVTADLAAKDRKRAIEDFDERRNLIKAQHDLGRTDQATYNAQVRENDLAQNDLLLTQQSNAYAQLGANDKEAGEAINSQIAQLQSKRIEILNTYDKLEIERSNTYYQQQLTTLETAKNSMLITESQFAEDRASSQIAQANAEILLQERTRARLGAADIQGRNAINAKINELETKKIQSLDALYQFQLERVRIAQDKASVLIQQSEIARNTILQSMTNDQLTKVEEIDRLKLVSSRNTLAEQLRLATEQEQQLAALATRTRTPESERAYQREVQAARTKTAQATLKLLENEGAELERLRNVAIKRIDDEQGARTRSTEIQLGQIESLKAARNRAAVSLELIASQETAAIERTSRALQLQSELLTAGYNLGKALRDATASENSIELAKIDRQIELVKQYESGSLSVQERLIVLAQTGSSSILALTLQRQDLEAKATAQKKIDLAFEQEQAQAQLKLDQKKTDLASRRAEIEAQISEIKARQGLLDAQSNLTQERLNSAKAIELAQAELNKAEQLAPGREATRQIEEARAKIQLALDTGEKNQSNALQAIDLAKQQIELSQQNTVAVKEQTTQQGKINQLKQETLDIQQKTVRSQFEAANEAKRQADELQRAKLEAQGLNDALNSRANRSSLPQNATPRGAIPTFDTASLPTLNIPTNGNPSAGTDNNGVIAAIKDLKETINSRNPQVVTNVAFNQPDSSQVDDFNKLQRSIARSIV